MLRVFIITLGLTVALWMLYVYHSFVPSLVKYYTPGISYNSSSMAGVVEELAMAPVVGHFYIEEAIFLSAVNRKWEKVLDLALMAI